MLYVCPPGFYPDSLRQSLYPLISDFRLLCSFYKPVVSVLCNQQQYFVGWPSDEVEYSARTLCCHRDVVREFVIIDCDRIDFGRRSFYSIVGLYDVTQRGMVEGSVFLIAVSLSLFLIISIIIRSFYGIFGEAYQSGIIRVSISMIIAILISTVTGPIILGPALLAIDLARPVLEELI
jgi:hypothetical protein